MNKVIENYDHSSEKIKVNVPLTSNLDKTHKKVLEALDISAFSKQTKKEAVKSTILEREQPVPTIASLKLQDAILRARTSILFGPNEDKENVSEIIDKLVKLKVIDENKKNKKEQFISLIDKINYFVEDEDKTKEKLEEIINEIDEAMTYLKFICSSIDSFCECRTSLSKIRYNLIKLYSDKLGKQNVR